MRAVIYEGPGDDLGDHRRELPELIDMVASGALGLAENVTQAEAMDDVVGAHEAVDQRTPGRLEVAVAAT